MSYLLDTNTVSFALRGIGGVAERLRTTPREGVAVSSITVVELRFGAAWKGSSRLERLIDAFLSGMSVLAFDELAAAQAGRLLAAKQRAGRSMEFRDGLLAAHALVLKRTLVTNNLRHFTGIEGLKIEDWQ